ncbi:pyridoxamine 5'-phosphate oxidase family protein [Kitasatospora sp. NPDC017646]|uniref:pyridoxamine 5'-phosphate oxidase family protein n=1 Tax=Kitasatospora sp. NPDC017646 TaxID=3364024 RepID=UPI0037AC28C7
MDEATQVPGGLERQECLSLLAGTGYGRVVFTARALPVVAPVNYLLDEDVVIGAGADARLQRLAEGDVVLFEAEGADSGTAWSVSVTGYVHPVTDAGEADRLISRTGSETPWVPGPAESLLRITTTQVDGRTFPITGAGPGRAGLPYPGATPNA